MNRNREKIIVAVVAAVCIAGIFALNVWRDATASRLSQHWDDLRAGAPATAPARAGSAAAETDFSLAEQIKKNVSAFRTQAEVRDIFSPVSDPVQPLAEAKAPMIKESFGENPQWVLAAIIPKPFPLQYWGKLLLGTGTLVAQVNAEQGCFLVRYGDRLGEYTVVQVGDEAVHLRRNDTPGQLIRLPFRRIYNSTELRAVFKENQTQQEIVVDKNTTFLGAQIVAVESDAVVFSAQGQVGRLQKGMVWK